MASSEKFGSNKADSLTATRNDQALYGGTNKTGSGTGNDTLNSSIYAGVSLYGADGNDTLIAKSGDLVIDGGTGADTAVFITDVASWDLEDAKLANVENIHFAKCGAGSYDFSNQTEALDITASNNGDTIIGGSAADTIRGGSGSDKLVGGKGNDVLIADEDDMLDGGDGVDTVSFALSVSDDLGDGDLVYVEKVLITASAAGTYDFSVQKEALTITGSGYADAIAGGTADDSISGLSGHDDLEGGDGNDTLSGGDGYDTLDGGNGVDQLSGGIGNDTLIAEDTDGLIDGGAGIDTVQFDAGVSRVNLLDKDLFGVEFIAITNTDNASYDFSVQSESFTINGGNGNDTIVGAKGVDRLYGGSGDDTLVAQETDALIDGGNGKDKVQFNAAVSATKLLDIDLVNVEVVEITNQGNARYDFSVQTEALEIDGGTGNDTIIGSRDSDLISGGKGADVLTGGAGDDIFGFAAGDSSTSRFDRVTDFKVDADSLDFGDDGRIADDAASVDVAAASSNTSKAITASIADGVITLGGADKAKVDSLSEWVAVAREMVRDSGDIGTFEFRGSTYVYQENGDSDHAHQDLLVQLVGVTGVSDVSHLLFSPD